ncbi:hypothetical protein GGF43_005671 [Coemansia sp. RSA 2618]|nr:hypothetical protein GGF43_005671 [Coemansia sp. RSA 2618]
MYLKCAISMMALAAAVINAAPVQTQHARKLEVDEMLSDMTSQYNDPKNLERYTSLFLSFASGLLPAGSDPSSEAIYSVLVSYKDKLGSMMLAGELRAMDKHMANIPPEDRAAYSDILDYNSMLHDSSVASRVADIMNRLVDNIIEDYETGKPTGSTEDDEDTKSNKEDDSKDATSNKKEDATDATSDKENDKDSESDKEDNNDIKSDEEDDDDENSKSDKEETTSGAASTKAGMLLMSVGAVAGVMAAMF